MAIGTTIKTIQDIMRKNAGVDGDAQRISQLVWMIFLKVWGAPNRYRAKRPVGACSHA
jgi:type I restriction enzyme M protein